ncbi:hypothetical protein AOL_s00215g630 [Orbilia oligospora ATCC 24927]|uniref:ShKT domain-containing protein n=1 Tax=Arthrobotrys oligospora (strain ATCC 24927 / CBS 115.81 / DSM 1491) TaxID=756982 RepID=G1XUH2_ARTOA|nr:hypothetical protein AOL_s00215g630 [Orbilia oligospora ATCC 24927]EGX43174.1 hypothetical protein AOL_s00215g630 [Orbilia oligospora ATCC 24927]
MKSFAVILMAIPAMFAVTAVAEHCPSPSVINSCWGECKRNGYATDACYNCCYYTCRPCNKR